MSDLISPRVRSMVAAHPVEWEDEGCRYSLPAIDNSDVWRVQYYNHHANWITDHIGTDHEAAALIALAWMEKLMREYALVQCRKLEADLFSVYTNCHEYISEHIAPSLMDALAEAVEAL